MNNKAEIGIDFKVASDGSVYAGTHLLVDMWGAKKLDDLQEIKTTLEQSARDAGATILHSYMHPFMPHGVSGVVVLSESHISIHTWPERHFAAIDIFMCGDCNPYDAIARMKSFFQPEKINISKHQRGMEP